MNIRTVVAVLLALSIPAAAWDGEGHQRITRSAVQAAEDLPAFFAAGAETIAHTSVDPDTWTRPMGAAVVHAGESPEHYMDWELVGLETLPESRYELLKHVIRAGREPKYVGFVPYAVTEWTQRLAVALAEHRKWPDNPHIRRKVLVYAGILAHYAADLNMPLHTTIHFDGRVDPNTGKSPRTGIHLNVDRLIRKLPADAAKAGRPKTFDQLLPAVQRQFLASHRLVDRVYELAGQIPDYDEPLSADSPVAEFARDRWQAAATFVASLYRTAWRDSASIEIPDWHTREGRPAPAPAAGAEAE